MPDNEERPVVFYSQGQKIFGNLCLPHPRPPGVIISHGLESSKDGVKWLVMSPRLCESGFACLRFSYRGCGEGDEKSEGNFEDTSLTARIQDYRTAIDFTVKQGFDSQRLGVIGSSFGGMIALAAQDNRIKVIVVMATPYHIPDPGDALASGGYVELGPGHRLTKRFFEDVRKYDMGKEIQKIHCPILIIQGSGDNIVPVEDARTLYKLANEPKRLEIIDGADHVFSEPAHLERVVNLSLEWFKTYL